jgi:hypothetical protein
MARCSTLGLACVCLSAISLIALGMSRLADGVARDRALPVPNALVAGRILPLGAYAKASTALDRADASDGEAKIFLAEARLHISSQDQSSLLEQGLSSAPVLVRGWTLLALSQAQENPTRAALILSQALLLAPHDYWVAGMRARAAAMLWSKLDKDSQNEALEQVRLLWDEPTLRPRLLELLSIPGGSMLVTKAFALRRDDLVSINRWVSARTRLLGG